MKFFRDIKAFSLVELMIVVLILGILASASTSLFDNYLRRSKTQEAVLFLSKISEAQITYYSQNDQFINLGPTNIPPTNARNSVDFFSNPAWNWQRVSFSSPTPILYGYQSYASGTEYVCEAQGDLDGDGDLSIFTIRVGADGTGKTYRSALTVLDELE